MQDRGKRKVDWSAVGLTGLIILSVGVMAWDRNLPRYYHNNNDQQHHDIIQTLTIPVSVPVPDPEPTEVRFTSYHVGDYSGSGTVTSSGLGIDDFQINENGWYTYEGKVVLAAATYTCLNATSGACGKYTELPKGYMIHSLHDEVTIFINGNNYPAIILDSCGASFWDEPLQRYDIFVKDEASITDRIGYLAKEGY